MKEFVFFPLWKIEDVEKYLESMEQKGYRLEKIKHSYYFHFKESKPKQMCYFLSYKSFRGSSMGHCDYALLSKHSANPIKSKWCFYEMYRTKEHKENLSLLYAVRADYIKTKLLENALASLFLTILFVASATAAIITQLSYKELCLFSPIIGTGVLLTIYCFYGYFKQRKKCKNYEHENFNNLNH